MSGTIPLSLTQQLDEFGEPLSGGKLYLIQAGTVSTPQNSYQDPALTITLPNPITLDAAGRLPQFFLADGFIKIRLLDATGIVQREADNVQVIGPSGGGGGGGGTTDPNAVIQTGDMLVRYGTGVRSGFVRANGLSIGNGGSGASERANADTQALFIYLYGADSSLAVSGGRTGNALTDYNNSRTIALPDWRGYSLTGLQDMGNALVERNGGYVGNTLGGVGGLANNVHTITVAELPAHNHAVTDPGHGHGVTGGIIGGTINAIAPGLQGGGTYVGPVNAGGTSGNITISAAGTGISIQNAGSGNALVMATLPPRKFCSVYMKL